MNTRRADLFSSKIRSSSIPWPVWSSERFARVVQGKLQWQSEPDFSQKTDMIWSATKEFYKYSGSNSLAAVSPFLQR